MSLTFEPAEATNARADMTVHLFYNAGHIPGPPINISMAQDGVTHQAIIEEREDLVIAKFPVQPRRPTTFWL